MGRKCKGAEAGTHLSASVNSQKANVPTIECSGQSDRREVAKGLSTFKIQNSTK